MERLIHISATNCGFDWDFSLEFALAFMQDCVTELYGSLNMSNFDMREKYNAMWVFTKNKVKVLRRPRWNEDLVASCNIVKANRFICYTKTSIYDKDNNLVMEGVVECCVLDFVSHKMLKLTDLNIIPTNEECDTTYHFIDEEFPFVKKFKVTHLLTDSSYHLNNAKAIFPLVDSFSEDVLEKIYSKPFELGIKYQAQAMYNTTLKMYYKYNNDELLFRYTNENGESIDLGYIRHI